MKQRQQVLPAKCSHCGASFDIWDVLRRSETKSEADGLRLVHEVFCDNCFDSQFIDREVLGD